MTDQSKQLIYPVSNFLQKFRHYVLLKKSILNIKPIGLEILKAARLTHSHQALLSLDVNQLANNNLRSNNEKDLVLYCH